LLYKRRIRQVVSKFARYFDSGTLYQKEDARLCADLIRVWVENNRGEWIRITGPDGAETLRALWKICSPRNMLFQFQEASPSLRKAGTASLLSGFGDKLILAVM